MSILKIVFIALEVLLLFNLLIFVHELGHFLAARWRGLKVDRFAIWFGKPIWSKRLNGVEYALGWIPAGGYVSLPQMATMEAIEGKSDNAAEPLPPVSALDKILVAFAGPLFSFLLALVFAVVIMIVGRPVSEAEMTTVVGLVEKGSPAEKAGLQPGDRIISVDGKPVSKFGGMGDSVTWRVVRSEGPTVPVKFERNGQILEVHATPVKEQTKIYQRKGLRQIKVHPAQSAIIAKVSPSSPAEKAGLKPGDQLVSINGKKVHHFLALAEVVADKPGAPVELEIQRAGNAFTATVTPAKPINVETEPKVGILWDANGRTKLAYPGAIEQVVDSVDAMVQTFGALLARKSDIKAQHLGGAVKIMDVYYRLFDSEQGWRLALWFSVLMNVNLAILNLLPVPVLDGGHILLAIIEGIRRKPLSAKIVGAIQTACAVLLIGFMVYIAFFDIQEVSFKREKTPEVLFAPKSGSVTN